MSDSLDHEQWMALASRWAAKGYGEGGCPIGGVLVDNATGVVLGQGHNALVQEGNPVIHGEMAALRDAGAPLSAADLIAARATMLGLATLRGHARPWRDDLVDALPGDGHRSEAPLAYVADGGVALGASFRQAETAWLAGLAAMARTGTPVLVDDVFTTGSTARACARTLLRAGAGRVELLAWARVIPSGQRP